jgi:hypothetical protein
MTAFELLKSAEDAGLVVTFEAGRLRASGGKHLGGLAKSVLSRREDIIDELAVRKSSCSRHAPESILGRLTRKLLKWRFGRMFQLDDSPHRVNVTGMANQILTAIGEHAEGPMSHELRAMVDAFQGIVARHQWQWRSMDYDFPEVADVVSILDKNPNDGPTRTIASTPTHKKYTRNRPEDSMARILNATPSPEDDVPF